MLFAPCISLVFLRILGFILASVLLWNAYSRTFLHGSSSYRPKMHPNSNIVTSNYFPQFLNVSRRVRFAREREKTEPVKIAVWGPGLRQSSAGQPARFYVGLPCTKQQCSEVYVWFQGPAIFTASNITRNASVATVEYVGVDAGKYEVYVDVFIFHNNRTTTMLRAQGSPFSLVVSHKGRDDTRIALPSIICRDAKWRSGRWLPCTGQNCPRTGWAWVPHDCIFPFYSPLALPALIKPVWIVIAGSSIQRGTFFSLVDSMLGSKAANLTESSFWKCWGWMDFVQGNFRVSYLDFRNERMFQALETDDVETDYIKHAMQAVRVLLSGNNHQGPDAFYLEVSRFSNILEDLAVIKSWFGLEWAGRFIVDMGKPSFGIAGHSKAIFMKNSLIAGVENHPELGIIYIDEEHMAVPFMHTIENDPFNSYEKSISQHYHHACDEGGMHSCSPVADMAAQILLHITFSSISRLIHFHSNEKAVKVQANVPFKFCLSCPPELVPFTVNISRIAYPKCHTYLPKEQ